MSFTCYLCDNAVNQSNSTVLCICAPDRALRVCYDCQERCHSCQGSGLPASPGLRWERERCPRCHGDGLRDNALGVEFGLIARPEEPPVGAYYAKLVRALPSAAQTPLGVFSSHNYVDADGIMRSWGRGEGAPNNFAYHAEVELEGHGFRGSLFLNRRHLTSPFSAAWFNDGPRPFVRLIGAPTTLEPWDCTTKIISERRVDRDLGLLAPEHVLYLQVVKLDLVTPREVIEVLADEETP